ncbi:MAG: hypothetical protein J1E95_09355 [Muribaculaceae bacterium]|nr:hypothetical protein [Muribaculaceae bacterium]
MEPIIHKHPKLVFTSLISYLNQLLDKKKWISLQDTYKMCDNHTLVNWIESNTNFSFEDDDSRKIMNVEFDSFANCYIAEDFGIENNGLCYMIAMCVSFIQNPPTRNVQDII